MLLIGKVSFTKDSLKGAERSIIRVEISKEIIKNDDWYNNANI